MSLGMAVYSHTENRGEVNHRDVGQASPRSTLTHPCQRVASEWMCLFACRERTFGRRGQLRQTHLKSFVAWKRLEIHDSTSGSRHAPALDS